MNKKPTEISPDLTIPGFDVTVHNPHSCQVRSQDGRYKFSVKIDESGEYPLIISGNIVSDTWGSRLGSWKASGIEYTTDADDVITQVANSLKLMDQLSSEGFSAKIEKSFLVLSNPAKPGYQLRMSIFDARKIVDLKNTSLYTWVQYYGPAYDAKANTKWQLDDINNERLIVTNKGLEELAEELKARVLSMGEEKDPRITQWVSEEIEKELRSQGFTFASKPEKGIVEFSHPSGLSGSLSFAPFTVGYGFDLNPRYPNTQFPTDIGTKKVVLFTLDRRKYREPYTKGFLAEEPEEVIHEFRRCLAIPLVHQEVGQAWKSDLLVPKLRHSKMLLVNPELDGNESIILELTQEKDKLVLSGMGEELSYPILDTPTVVDTEAITRAIVERAEKHVQEFSQKTGYIFSQVVEVPELDF
jgi:hypothetical protein